MSKFEKAKKRILSRPYDYTYDELRYLLGNMGFEEFSKGKTSGSRLLFFRTSDSKAILVHKPHKGNQMDRGAVTDIVNHLKGIGEL